MPDRLNPLLGTGDDDGVEAKEKSGQRGRYCPEEKPTVHRQLSRRLS
jgi:hypothetical protein